jgi:hypothetical protein
MLVVMDDKQCPLGHGASRGRRQGAARILQRFLGFNEDDTREHGLVEELHGWALGLPFVEELDPIPVVPHLRRFAISCAPLECSAVWLLTGRFEPNAPGPDVNVYAVLPRSLAPAVAGAGGILGPDLPDDRRFVGLGSATTSGELLALEDVLLIAYMSAFPDT